MSGSMGKNLGMVIGFVLLVGFLSVRPVAAGVTAVFEDGDGERVTIEYRDQDHVRLESAEGSFVVVTDGEGYVVNREGGQWQVFAMADVAAMAGDLGQMTREDREGELRFRDTGRHENVAGIRGEVHEVIKSDDRSGEQVVGEMVLSDDADAVAIYRGLMRITEMMGAMSGQEGIDDDLLGTYVAEERAILRADDAWRLISIERSSIPDRHFTLPAEPMEMPGFGAPGYGPAPGQAPRSAPGAQAPRSAPGAQAPGRDRSQAEERGWLQKETEDLGKSAADEARDETRRGVKEEVQEGVREGIRGLFGR